MRIGFPRIRRILVVVGPMVGSWLLVVAPAAGANGPTGPGGWHRVDLPGVTGQSRLHAVAGLNGEFVGVGVDVGAAGPAVWHSADGSTWEKVADVEESDDAVMAGRDRPPSPGRYLAGRAGRERWGRLGGVAGWVLLADACWWRTSSARG